MSDPRSPMPNDGGRSPVGDPHPHWCGPDLVTGRARFVGDDRAPEGMLHLAPVTSPVAHGHLRSIDPALALAMPGVVRVITAADIPGQNQIGGIVADETLMAEGEVSYVGEVVAAVVARDPVTARQAAAAVRLEIDPLDPVLTIEEAVRRGSYVGPIRRIERGDPDGVFATAPHVLSGVAVSGAQEHLYLETQRCRAFLEEDGALLLQSSTQHPTEVQRMAAQVLGIPRNQVCVEVRRLGGGFGGKESQATSWACLAALAARLTGRPVEVLLHRDEDMRFTGKRHPYEAHWRIAFDGEGRILAYEVDLRSNAGAVADCSTSILERSMLHADNAYDLPHVRIVGRPCRTHLPPATAFRGFGAPQGVFAIESAIQAMARHLGLDPLEVRRRNLYREGQTTPYGQPVTHVVLTEMLDRARELADWDRRRQEIARFNASSRTRRKGIAVTPVKFGISFTAAFLNQAGALVHVYGDGSVSVSHGAIEMGQQVQTKIAQVAAEALGVRLDRIRIETTSTRRVANMSPTAASTGADLNGAAVRRACLDIQARLRAVAAPMLGRGESPQACSPEDVRFQGGRVFDVRFPDRTLTFEEVVQQAFLQRVDLSAHGFFATPGVAFDREAGRGTPFAYYVFGVGISEVTVDLLTGATTVDRAVLVHEAGESLNPAVDRGQVIGAYVQGLGWALLEEVVWDDQGRLQSASATTYKIPSFGDAPRDLVVVLWPNPRPVGVLLRSKAVGEPPFLYGESAFFAVEDAIQDLASGALRLPATAEQVLLALPPPEAPREVSEPCSDTRSGPCSASP
ncbi:MAG TPA: xanthine dehydrogenase molybdopterin binding subunit [Myxococcota bacterium]|nr:xanthine dehydrogenase molybdopterin binding subunit [Myxococcota bacterium]HQK51154.1 xanthine dehydrogenase molybdopterin binding subunit [Myxococcota bacterium]